MFELVGSSYGTQGKGNAGSLA
ncbi:hypothetical protein OOU_Y34scaffold00594g34 [Pyricularia oryzae Y34]|uniref:Uncharacterized protein n=2 Tax=Pyricularia oryzae TaxID=318829 RepID=A0AA97NW17_PYRO3|nr:hypothetical protein OOU_Y34scaffold00594g34 [Pyricularia oryzae Y34]